ncbi:MAG: AI-2E family transporter [Candidatus Woesebacteria bacterium]|nr:AI-2E family transporter [Candidatus Woesebacteria bacterium]
MRNHIDVKKHSKYFFTGSFIVILAISLYILYPFRTSLLASVLLAYIFYPVYRKLKTVVKNRTIAAFSISFFIILITAIPILFAANAIVNESVQFFYQIREIDLSEFSQMISKYFGQNIDLNFYFKDILNNLSISIMQGASNFIIALPGRVLDAFVMLFATFYLFLDGKYLIHRINDSIPLKDDYKEKLFKKFSDVIFATVYGVIVTAVIQGSIGALGLWIFGIESPIVWGLVMIIAAMIPFVGPAFIWFPAALAKIFAGESFNGFGLLLYGLLIVSTIDNVVRPKIIGSRGKMHPVLVLLGVLGGLKVFGLVGVVFGPLILAITMVFLEFYLSEKHDIKRQKD